MHFKEILKCGWGTGNFSAGRLWCGGNSEMTLERVKVEILESPVLESLVL